MRFGACCFVLDYPDGSYRINPLNALHTGR